MQNKKALVVGSVAYDIIFSVHNEFKKEVIIKDGKVADISIMLRANKKQMYFGGTAGNISYGLGIQGFSPILVSSVGKDFVGEFNTHLMNNNVDTRVKIYEEEYIASFYSISDTNREQIGIFQPNTHEYIHTINISDFVKDEEKNDISVAICSPGTGESMLKHAKQIRNIFGDNITLIADPSQILSIFFSRNELLELLSISDIFVGNETEVSQLQEILNMTLSEISNSHISTIIETRGSDGVLIHTSDSPSIHIEAYKVDNFVEATGAGDAFRAGLIGGLLEEYDIVESVKRGAEVASKSVQFVGGQMYKI